MVFLVEDPGGENFGERKTISEWPDERLWIGDGAGEIAGISKVDGGETSASGDPLTGE